MISLYTYFRVLNVIVCVWDVVTWPLSVIGALLDGRLSPRQTLQPKRHWVEIPDTMKEELYQRFMAGAVWGGPLLSRSEFDRRWEELRTYRMQESQ